MGLRAGWRVFIVLLVGGVLDVEVVRPNREQLLSSPPSMQLWGLPATRAGSSSTRCWPLWSPVSCSPRRWALTSCTSRRKFAFRKPLCAFQRSNEQPSACEVRQMSWLAAATFTDTCNTFGQSLANTITMSLSFKTLPVSCPDSARPINAGSRMST